MPMILPLLLPIKQWEKAPQLQIFYSKMACCATWITFMFLQVSMQRWFQNPITVSWWDILEWKRWWKCCKSTFIGWNFDRMSENISYRVLPMLSPNQLLRSRDYTHPYWPLTSLRIPSQWITCPTYHPQCMAMTTFLWLLVGSLRWTFWQPARRISWLRPWPSSCFSIYGFIFGSHR